MRLRNPLNLNGGVTHLTDGIDVSNHNGNFDWNAWNGHIEFGIAKASEGVTYHDPEFTGNWDKMMGLGINRFAYHYFRGAHNPTAQAHWFYNIVKAAGLAQHDNLAIDIEEYGNTEISPIEMSTGAFIMCQELKLLAPGHKILIYTNPSYAEQGNCAKLGGFPLWIANWDTPVPHVPGPWKTWTFWQTAFHSVGRDVFNGTVKQLDDFCDNTGQPKYLTVTVAKWELPDPVWNSTLSGIAAHYRVPGGWQILAELNHINHPDNIQPGQKIYVPA